MACVRPVCYLLHPGHVLRALGSPHAPPLPHALSGPGLPLITDVISKDTILNPSQNEALLLVKKVLQY